MRIMDLKTTNYYFCDKNSKKVKRYITFSLTKVLKMIILLIGLKVIICKHFGHFWTVKPHRDRERERERGRLSDRDRQRNWILILLFVYLFLLQVRIIPWVVSIDPQCRLVKTYDNSNTLFFNL